MPQHVTLSNGYKLDIPDGLTNDQISDRVNHMEGLINPQWKGLVGSVPVVHAQCVAAITDPAGRIAAAGLNLNPAIGGADLTVSGLNALKAVASRYAPSLRNTPDIPTVSGLAGSAAGVAPLSPDASPVQRYAEAAATGLANPKQAIRTGLEMVGATGGGDAGELDRQLLRRPRLEPDRALVRQSRRSGNGEEVEPRDFNRWFASARRQPKRR